ncbi:hypothetical protein PtA15_12A143 [Puccinia triticina]|uniref:Uncharacterized protein n=1 Tax=Puccinia triticina TaxID=208348 RepID=A0ABY7D0E3_9BASI|nr:uncharacterized protein PtA15_12A143 [Puccinia triticina]WAQ90157.1 hypothetical protein PtA15_12A143 [Puccinia triticina]
MLTLPNFVDLMIDDVAYKVKVGRASNQHIHKKYASLTGWAHLQWLGYKAPA